MNNFRIFSMIFGVALCLNAFVFAPAFAKVDYPSHQQTSPITLPVSNIVVQDAGRVGARGGFGNVENPAADISRYINARYRASGQGQTLIVKITRASILNQGRSKFGDARKHVDINLDLMLSANSITPTKTARVKYSRYVNDGYMPRSALPVKNGTDIMKNAIKTIDRQFLAALKNQLKILDFEAACAENMARP